jgi:hypothetical protein
MPDKAGPQTIMALFHTLEDRKFVYLTRFEKEVDNRPTKLTFSSWEISLPAPLSLGVTLQAPPCL